MNEPADWSFSGANSLRLRVAPGTNFWQRTKHGRSLDNGHFLSLIVAGDFDMEVAALAYPNSQYDQAGLMARASDRSWIKTSAEFERPGWSRLGVVVTNDGWSDWSSQDVARTDYRFRVRRRGADFFIDVAAIEGPWSQIRVAHLVEGERPLSVGVYACAPVGNGFDARFEGFRLEQLGS